MVRRKPSEAKIGFLLEILASRDSTVREKARKSLVTMGKPVVAPLVKALKDSKSAQIRWEAIKALGDIGDVKAIPQLVKALEDVDSDVTWLAAEELSRFKKAAWPSLLDALMVDKRNEDLLRAGAHHVFFKQKEKGFDDLLAKLIKALEPEVLQESSVVVARAILKRMKAHP